jgi:flagellar assembly protein FliH
MSHAKPKIRNVPPPSGHEGKAAAYTRFIPREELNAFAAWTPGAFADAPGAAAQPEPAAPTAEDRAEQLRAAHQAGYHDGYRDGLAALEQFKQSVAQQAGAQLGSLLAATQAQLGALQQEMASALALAAMQLARQVVRTELTVHPETVAVVAAEAVDALLQGARHVGVRVHPDDHAFVAHGASVLIAERGIRLAADAGVARGGVVVESDAGVIDAGIETRWRRACAALGIDGAWPAAGDDRRDGRDAAPGTAG